MGDFEAVLHELEAARSAFLDTLSEVDAALVTAPGAVGEWSVRDLVVHVAAWNDHGADALALAAAGRGSEFAYSRDDTDAMNERFAAEASRVSPADALEREERSFARFRDAVVGLDSEALRERLGNGDTVEEVIRYDGPDHYAEHTEQLRAWFGPETDGDDGNGG